MKILIVDDHKMFCDGLKLILNQLEEAIEVLEADSGATALQLAGKHLDIDLVMLDINLPDQDGIQVLMRLSDEFPTLPVIMLTASENRGLVRRCFERGASGYILKSSGADVMLSAVRLVLSGGTYVPASMVFAGQNLSRPPAGQPGSNMTDQLTTRQLEVLEQLKLGSSNKQIADRLGVSEATVKVHISAILKTLGVRSRVEAALLAQKLDMTSG